MIQCETGLSKNGIRKIKHDSQTEHLPDSYALEIGEEQEKAAFGMLKITALGQLLTEGTEISDDFAVYRAGPYVSGYHLAE